jgi:hypothetical protein
MYLVDEIPVKGRAEEAQKKGEGSEDDIWTLSIGRFWRGLDAMGSCIMISRRIPEKLPRAPYSRARASPQPERLIVL